MRLCESIAVSLVALASFVPPMAAGGLNGAEIAAVFHAGGALWSPEVDVWSRRVGEHAGPFVLALVASALLWLVALLLYAFLEAGILGVLVSGDRQAPPGARAREWFRTFTVGDLAGWGRRLMGRMLGLCVVAFCLCVGWALATALWLGLSGAAAQRWGGGAAVGIGCGGALPVAFGWAVLGLWWFLAQALVADERAGFFSSLVEALRLVGRRLGGLILIVFVLLVVGVAINIVFLPLSIGIDLALVDRLAPRLAAATLLGLAQWLALSMVGVLASSTLVALSRAGRSPASGERA